jgi:protein-S-isoprenylcysteine O-methyltransferase Ste14
LRWDYGYWNIVLANVLFISFFLLGFLRPKGRAEWRNLGLVEAFFVALYAEMYGFPLTIYLLTSVFGMRLPVLSPFSHTSGHLWATLVLGSRFTNAICTLGSYLLFGGLVVLGIGWFQIHRSRGRLVTWGLYRFIRHPQYLALFLITTGMLIQWPTLPTLLMWPVLLVMYSRLALEEEKNLRAAFGAEYEAYRSRTPAFFPRLWPSPTQRVQES